MFIETSISNASIVKVSDIHPYPVQEEKSNRARSINNKIIDIKAINKSKRA